MIADPSALYSDGEQIEQKAYMAVGSGAVIYLAPLLSRPAVSCCLCTPKLPKIAQSPWRPPTAGPIITALNAFPPLAKEPTP